MAGLSGEGEGRDLGFNVPVADVLVVEGYEAF